MTHNRIINGRIFMNPQKFRQYVDELDQRCLRPNQGPEERDKFFWALGGARGESWLWVFGFSIRAPPIIQQKYSFGENLSFSSILPSSVAIFASRGLKNMSFTSNLTSPSSLNALCCGMLRHPYLQGTHNHAPWTLATIYSSALTRLYPLVATSRDYSQMGAMSLDYRHKKGD